MWRIFVGWNVTTGGATSRAVSDYLYLMKALLRWFEWNERVHTLTA